MEQGTEQLTISFLIVYSTVRLCKVRVHLRTLRLDPKSLEFTRIRSKRMEVVISSVGDPFSLVSRVHSGFPTRPGQEDVKVATPFGAGIKSLRLDRAKIRDFSTESLLGLPKDARVTLVNCTLQTPQYNSWHQTHWTHQTGSNGNEDDHEIKLESLTFKDLTLSDAGGTFLDAELDNLRFEGCNLNFFSSFAVRTLVRKNVSFEKSNLRILAAEALDIKADRILFEHVQVL